jgi:hypothetical protein
MTIQTIAPVPTDEPGDNSYNTGYTDGEYAALEKLPARRAMARAAMADDHDPLYAQGYADGYLHQIGVTAALREKQETQR